MTARDGRNEKQGRSGDDLSLESLIEEPRVARRIFRISGDAAEPEQGPEGGSGTAKSEPEPPENSGPRAS